MNSKTVLGADPYVMFDPKSKQYFCYATGNVDDQPFLVYKSDDLVHWKKTGIGLDRSVNDWGKGWFWAPEVYYNPNNEHYYMFYSALVKNELCEKYFGKKDFLECCKIGVAVSEKPDGPFINLEDHPIDYYPYDKDYKDIDSVTEDPFSKAATTIQDDSIPKGIYIPAIDADFFIDEDGRMYLYYSRCCYRNCLYDKHLNKYVEESNILGVELDPDFWYDKEAKMSPRVKEEYIYEDADGRRKDKFHQIISYHHEPQDWENGHVNDYENSNHMKHNRRWSEGSMTIIKKLDDKKKYLLFYSSNNFENALYGVGAAYSESPMDEFKKYDKNPIIHQIPEMPLFSTGHGCVVKMNGEDYYFFHGRENCSQHRICYVARLHIDAIDNIYVTDIKQCELI